jgi:hypothetical protein
MMFGPMRLGFLTGDLGAVGFIPKILTCPIGVVVGSSG